MAISVEQVRLAMTAVSDASPEERRQRLVALMTAGNELAELVARYQRWLEQEDAWLEANPDHAEYVNREERYLTRVKRYQDAHTVLGVALEMVKGETE